MYLEISPRQAGKTTRMVEAIIDHVRTGRPAYVQTHNNAYFRGMFMDKLAPYITNHARGKLVQYVRDVRHWTDLRKGMDRNDGHRVFADEFDMIGREPNRLVFDRDGYYCGSAMYHRTATDIILFLLGERKDPLLQLIEMNNGKHETYSPMSMFLNRTIDDLKNMQRNMPEDVWDIEIMGNMYK